MGGYVSRWGKSWPIFIFINKLVRGQSHNSVADFQARHSVEQEADEFAARLLMPRELFVEAVHRYRQRVCILSELCHLAENVFHTSLTSTV